MAASIRYAKLYKFSIRWAAWRGRLLTARIPRTRFSEMTESFRLGAGKSDHLGPLIGFFGDEPSEVGRRARQRDAAQVGNPRLPLGISKTRVDFPVELVDDFGGRVPGCAGAEPGARLVARPEFGNGREVRQRLRARCGRHCERAQRARPDVLNRRCGGAEGHLHLSAQHVGHSGRHTTIRHVYHIHTGHHLKKLAEDMWRAAATW